MSEERRPLRAFVNICDKLLNWIVLILILILALYSAYSIWYTRSLTDGSFLSDELAMYKPTGHDPTLDDLIELNPDVRAWLTVDDTNIDYPLVQGATDLEYLNKDVQGRFSLAGAIFLASANAPDFSDAYNVLYGHHIEGGAMFSDVMEFKNASFFETHPSGTLWLPDRAYHIQIFAYMDADAMDTVIYQPPERVTPEALPSVVEYILDGAAQKQSVEVVPGDSIVAMSTCEDAEGFGRCLLFGKLVPMTEEEMRLAEEENLKAQEGQLAETEEETAESRSLPLWVLPCIGIFLFLFLILFLIRKKDRTKE